MSEWKVFAAEQPKEGEPVIVIRGGATMDQRRLDSTCGIFEATFLDKDDDGLYWGEPICDTPSPNDVWAPTPADLDAGVLKAQYDAAMAKLNTQESSEMSFTTDATYCCDRCGVNTNLNDLAYVLDGWYCQNCRKR